MFPVFVVQMMILKCQAGFPELGKRFYKFIPIFYIIIKKVSDKIIWKNKVEFTSCSGGLKLYKYVEFELYLLYVYVHIWRGCKHAQVYKRPF